MKNELATALTGHKALLVVDMQRDYCVPEGVIGSLGHDTSHFAEVATRLNTFIERARPTFRLIVFVRTVFPPWPRSRAVIAHYQRSALSRVRNDSLADWFGVSPLPTDPVIEKFRYSAFADTPLSALLRASEIDTVLVAGATTDVCVDTTVRDAFMRDYSVIVLSDCCGASTPARHAHALDVLDSFFARVHRSDEVIASLADSQVEAE